MGRREITHKLVSLDKFPISLGIGPVNLFASKELHATKTCAYKSNTNSCALVVPGVWGVEGERERERDYISRILGRRPHSGGIEPFR